MSYLFTKSCQIDHDLLNMIFLDAFGYKTDGYFVEVGSYDGISFSNTYELSRLGWSGLYIEPMVEFLNQCKINHRINPNIQYANCAISDYNGISKFYMGDWASTLCEDVVDASPLRLHRNRYREIQVHTLDYICNSFSVPIDFDLLVVDTEGADEDVMKGFSIQNYKPKLVIIEYQHEKFDQFEEYFNSNNYKLVSRDTCNLIYRIKQ